MLVIIDRYIKIAKYFPYLEIINVGNLTDLFLNTILPSFGIPKGIISNRRAIFISTF